MFYSQDLLCRRSGRFAVIWLLAHTPPRSRSRYVSSKDVSAIDIPRACADILLPPAPMSLRFVSTLLLGLAQTLGRQATLLHADTNAARSRIVTAPWVAINRSAANSHMLPPAEAIANIHAITLPDALVPEYPNWHANSEHWVLASVCLSGGVGQNPRLQACQQLGWLGEVDTHALPSDSSVIPHSSSPLRAASSHSGASYTAAWESISIPDADMRRATRPTASNDSPGLLLLHSSSPAQRIPPVPSGDDLIQLADDAEEPSFHFDHEGNLQFAPLADSDHSRDLSLDAEPHTQLLGQFASIEQDLRAPHVPHRDDSPTANPSSAIRHEQALEIAENDVLCNVETSDQERPAKRQRVTRRQLAEICSIAATGTFIQRVPELWANTCYWHAESQATLHARASKNSRCHIAQQVHKATMMYSVPDICDAAQLLGPLPPELCDLLSARGSPVPSDQGPLADYDDDNGAGMYGEGEDVLELELGRGGTPATNDLLAGNDQYPDIHLDIPWLNPDIFNPAWNRQSMGQALSIRTESSPEPALHQHHRQSRHSASSIGTPASRAPSLDPPSSDDGIEIQSFQLAAHNLGEPEPGCPPLSEHGLDSFLDVSRFGPSGSADGGQSAIEQLDKDSSSFRQFALARMAEHGTDTLVFDNLLQHPYRNRRVAARAFADLLQMATKSVFGVSQSKPFATINISTL
ncbi:R8 protein [Coemansia pectinata]|uniref:R8 protein n=1 Tax=Coemansia pectinata TaxID=1052879 RepID=A0A9W8LB65_9FUNG|nr:R8 protein [Coemansia pectinata]